MGSTQGISEAKLIALTTDDSGVDEQRFSSREKAALDYADAMTLSAKDVSDEIFGALAELFSEDEIVELTTVVAWENASSKFNRALRVESQGLWKRG